MRSVMVCTLLVLAITPARAQPETDTQNKPEAERLFEEGRKLLADGHPDDACKRFEQSILKDPRAVGTLLNLGLCNERSGKVATALELFREAYDRANEANMPAERQAAQEHIASLSPQVPAIELAFAGPPLAETKLLIDDKIVALDAKQITIDPGRHEVVLTAPGRLPYQTQINVAVASHTVLKLPVLEQPRSGKPNDRKVYGRVALLGGAGLVVGASALAAVGWRNYNKAFDDGKCIKSTMPGMLATCDPDGQRIVDRSRLYGTIATFVGGVGVVAAIAGAVLIYTAPNAEQHIVPTGSSHEVGLVYFGRF